MERGAQIRQLDGEPGVGLPLSGRSHSATTSASRRASGGDGRSALVDRTARGELLGGELADGLQHRVSVRLDYCSATSSDLRMSSIQQIEDGEVVGGVLQSCYGAGAVQVESTGEDRTLIQQRLFRLSSRS